MVGRGVAGGVVGRGVAWQGRGVVWRGREGAWRGRGVVGCGVAGAWRGVVGRGVAGAWWLARGGTLPCPRTLPPDPQLTACDRSFPGPA